jgi:hypothetical protein
MDAMKNLYDVYVKMKFKDGTIIHRHLWLDNLRSQADARMAASQAVDYNKGVVLAAWVEPAPEPEPTKKQRRPQNERIGNQRRHQS